MMKKYSPWILWKILLDWMYFRGAENSDLEERAL